MSELHRLAKKFRTLNSFSLGLLIVSAIGLIAFLAGLLIPNSLLTAIGFSTTAATSLIYWVIIAPLEQRVLRKIQEETNRRLDEADGQ